MTSNQLWLEHWVFNFILECIQVDLTCNYFCCIQGPPAVRIYLKNKFRIIFFIIFHTKRRLSLDKGAPGTVEDVINQAKKNKRKKTRKDLTYRRSKFDNSGQSKDYEKIKGLKIHNIISESLTKISLIFSTVWRRSTVPSKYNVR